MSQLFAKIRQRGGDNKYRKLLSTDQRVYPECKEMIEDSVPYDPQTLLDEGWWYAIEDFSQSGYAIDILAEPFDTVDFEQLVAAEMKKIDYIFADEGDELYFQNITKSRLVRRKAIIHVGKDFRYDAGSAMITLNEVPDAVYVRTEDTLYFRNISSITGIFTRIGELYRVATEGETALFLGRDFITLKNDFSPKQVKTANRKRIALAEDTLSQLQGTKQKEIFQYIKRYCPNLESANGSIEVGSEEDLKMLLYGIEQRFYTTDVGKEKRIANSVIPLN